MTGRVLSVVGARPQFVKAAVVSRALASAGFDERLVHTGQHYDAAMSAVFFEELGLPAPAHHLGIGGLSHGAMTGRMLEALEERVVEERPDWVLVYGDTNSTLAGALAAAKLGVPVAHVEAGMRSFNRTMPEEINRVLTDHVATLNLVTSEAPRRLLVSEGITEGVHVVGDVMFDAARVFGEIAAERGACERLGLAGDFGLVTLHRAENTDDQARLSRLLSGLGRVAEGLSLVLPLHPRTKKQLERFDLEVPNGVRVIEPIGYLDMLALERRCRLVLTDSGGVQKEALYAGVRCVTMRDETEWTETVDVGWNVLVGADADALVAAAERQLDVEPSPPPSIYGDGDAAEQIAALL